MYLDDPRVNEPIIYSGNTLASGNRTAVDDNGTVVKEPLYKWNGCLLDLCGMDPEDKTDGYMAPPTFKMA